jgi:hypothetical protein
LGAGLGAAGLLLFTRGVTNTGFNDLLHLGSKQGSGSIEEDGKQQPTAIRG